MVHLSDRVTRFAHEYRPLGLGKVFAVLFNLKLEAMKIKNLLIAIVACFAMGTVSAQEFSIGPKIGISQGNVEVTGDGFSKGSSKVGYHVGLFARLGGNAIFVQPEVLYTNTGGKFKQEQGSDQVNYEASFNRLDVPVLVGLKLANLFRIQVGPVASFMLDSEITQDVGNAELPDYKKSTLAYQAGIGLDIGNMILDLKYEGPLGKISDKIAGFSTDQRQNQLILSLGIRLF